MNLSLIRIIAGATFRESFRSKSFVMLLVLYLAGTCIAPIVGWISGTDGSIVTADLIFSLLSIVGVLVATATGTALVHTEIKQHTLYTVLSRPIHRWQFVCGKYLGLCAALIAGQLIMLATGLTMMALNGLSLHIGLLWAGLLITLEVCIMAAVSLTWTALSSPLLAAVFSLATYAVGHFVHGLPGLMYHLEGVQIMLVAGLASLIPDLGYYAYRNEAIYGMPAGSDELIALPYALCWITLLLFITTSVIRRKQL